MLMVFELGLNYLYRSSHSKAKVQFLCVAFISVVICAFISAFYFSISIQLSFPFCVYLYICLYQTEHFAVILIRLLIHIKV